MKIQPNSNPELQFPIAVSIDLVIQELNDELLIYNPKTNKVICLNYTSWLVFNLSNGKNTIQDISRLMEINFRQYIPEDIVWLTLKQLADQGLIENHEQFKNKGAAHE